MTDFDVTASDDLMRQAIFSRDVLPLAHVRGRLIHEGLSFPLWIGAMQGRRYVKSEGSPGWFCHLHPGLTYVTWQGSPDLLREWGDTCHALVSEPILCERANDWLPLLRDAIVSLRESELGAGSTESVREYSLEDERHAFELAVQHILADHHNWLNSVGVWMGITLRRHHNQLDTVRRKIVELLGRITYMVDQSSTLGHTFRSAINRIYGTYDFMSLPEGVTQSVREMVPLLLGRDPERSRLGQTTQKALDYLRSHYQQPVSLADVADVVHVSPAHLSRQFKRDTGHTFINMLHSLRIARSRQLLAETDETVLAIALKCGFESVEHFHRIFKRHTGYTPHRYRKMNA